MIGGYYYDTIRFNKSILEGKKFIPGIAAYNNNGPALQGITQNYQGIFCMGKKACKTAPCMDFAQRPITWDALYNSACGNEDDEALPNPKNWFITCTQQ